MGEAGGALSAGAEQPTPPGPIFPARRGRGGLGGAAGVVGDGVADADVVEVLDGGDDESDLAGADLLDALGAGDELAEVGDLVELVGAHQADLLALDELAVDDADVDDDAAVV